MGMVTGERLQSGRFGALPKLGSLVIEDEVARGPASVVYAARLAAKPGATAELQRIALKAYDPTLRFQDAQAQCFELAIDERIARTRRRDETGDLPKDRLYRATDIVRAAPASLEALGSLKATILFWGEVAHALGAAHARGAAHGHFRPAHALVVRDSRETRRTNGVEESEPEARPLIVDAGIVLTPKAAKMAPESAALLAPEVLEALLADGPAPATLEGDVYSLAASLVVVLGGCAPGLKASEKRGGTLEALLEAKREARAPVVAAAALPARAVDQRALGALLARALDADATKRPRDGAAFGNELTETLMKEDHEKEPSGKAEHSE